MKYHFPPMLLLALAPCSMQSTQPGFPVMAASDIDQSAVNLMLVRDSQFRKLESRIDAIRRGDITVNLNTEPVKEAYAVKEQGKKNIPHRVRHYDPKLGIIRTHETAERYMMWQVSYDFLIRKSSITFGMPLST